MANNKTLSEAFRSCAAYRQSSSMGVDRPMVAIVIDNVGDGAPRRTDQAVELGEKHALTYAFLPVAGREAQLQDWTIKTYLNGDESIMHMPMATVSAAGNKETPLYSRLMRDDTAESITHKVEGAYSAFEGVDQFIIGANNHQGSAFTQDFYGMKAALSEMKEAGMQFFMDSKTTGHTVAVKAGQAVGLPVVTRDVFLDHVKEKDAIEAQLIEAVHVAHRNGSSIAIGHHYEDTTLKILEDMLPSIEEQCGVELVALSDVVEHRLGIDIKLNNL